MEPLASKGCRAQVFASHEESDACHLTRRQSSAAAPANSRLAQQDCTGLNRHLVHPTSELSDYEISFLPDLFPCRTKGESRWTLIATKCFALLLCGRLLGRRSFRVQKPH